jgi:amino acid transporter
MAKAKKFGAFGGVFTPSILTILGVIMYLRLPWIVGQAGLWATLGIILVAHIISGSTGLSVASIATDKKVESGGTYYIISRSLGLPIGGTLGWALFVGLSFSVSLYLIGFAEIFLGFFGFEVNINTIRIAGSIILFLVTVLTFISTSLAIKTQYIILSIMVLSLVSVFLGRHEYAPEVPQLGTATGSLPWIALFAIFFPAVTGFEAGVSMSGDLKDPRRAIPLGTIMAILVGLVVYIGLAFFLSYTVQSDLLVNDTNALLKISWIPQLVVAGILGATLSSALGSILGAPRILQAVAKDRIAPRIFSKGFGASNEPRNAIILTFIIAQAGILIGDLNVIARIVTIFFIITYGFLNITYTVESWASSDFRPSFKFPRFVSIIGALACIIVMIQLDILALAGASIVLIALFFYLRSKELILQTGDSRSSIWLSLVKTGLLKLAKSKSIDRNWRPNVILFSGGAQNRPHLIELGKMMTGKLGVFTNFELIEDVNKALIDKTAQVSVESFGNLNNIITRKHVCTDIYDGISMISRVYGFSGFEPNTILMGWAKNTRNPKKMEELLVTLNKLDYNLTFLKYDEKKGFGNHKQIDFWWSGKGRNLALAIHLIRFITVNPDWRNANIRLLAINDDSRYAEKYYALLKQIIDNYRINAEIKVINNVEKLAQNEIIRSESGNASLTIIEIPGLLSTDTHSIIVQANELTDSLHSCLLIHASTSFEEINVASKTQTRDLKAIPKQEINVVLEKSIATNIILSNNEMIDNMMANLANRFDQTSKDFIKRSLLAISSTRNAIVEQINSLTERNAEKIIAAHQLSNPEERYRKLLIVANDYSYHIQLIVNNYKELQIREEIESMQYGVQNFFESLDQSMELIPEHIRLMFGIVDYKKLKTKNFVQAFDKTLKIFRLSIVGEKASFKINLHPIARHYLSYQQLIYFNDFIQKFASQSVSFFGEIRDSINLNAELLEQALNNKTTAAETIAANDHILNNLKSIRESNIAYVEQESDSFFHQLSSALNHFALEAVSPQANYQNRKLKSNTRKSEQLRAQLLNFPEMWQKLLTDHINKTTLDYRFIHLKNRLASIIEKLCSDVDQHIETHILSKLKDFEKLVMENDKQAIKTLKERVLEKEELTIPDFNDMFSQAMKKVDTLIKTLPEEATLITGEQLANTRIDSLENVEALVVPVQKTAFFYISNELGDRLIKQKEIIEQQVARSVSSIKDLIRLIHFNIDHINKALLQDDLTQTSPNQQIVLIENLIKNIQNEENKLSKLQNKLMSNFSEGLNRAFEPLSSVSIINTSSKLKEKIREKQKRRFPGWIKRMKNASSKVINDQVVKLLYSKSEGLLWAKRLEQSQERAQLYPGESIKKVLAQIAPSPRLMQKIPFYYANLFSGKPGLSEGFWVGMKEELEQGGKAIERFKNGATGMLIITGERSSGKSSLSKRLASLHYPSENIFNLKAPKESYADVTYFDQTLAKCLGESDDVQYSLDMLPQQSVIIIDDLELWWERKPHGKQVIERIILLMQQYAHKVLFIVNVNKYALKIIDQLCSINSWAIDLVFCQPLDARELKELIMLRHQAGSMKFLFGRKHETAMSSLDYARLFNTFFDLSAGNPGYAMNLWMACVQNVRGNTLIMKKPLRADMAFDENLLADEIVYILQFILHRRFSIASLAEVLQNNLDDTERDIRKLLQKGIVIEKFTGVFALNPALEIHLVKKIKKLELL